MLLERPANPTFPPDPCRSGNSLLLYGFGSKRALLDQWARQVLTDGAAVTVNGFNPAVTAKQVALAAAAVLLPSSMR